MTNLTGRIGIMLCVCNEVIEHKSCYTVTEWAKQIKTTAVK